MKKLSIVIPSYKDPYLDKTIEDVLSTSNEDVEVVVVLDGCKHDPIILNPSVKYIELDKNEGMRNAINVGVKNATGEYIMKCDSHCKFADGFDVILKTCTKDRMISIPSRYHLDPVKWKRTHGPINFAYLKYPKDENSYGFRTRRSKEHEKNMNSDNDDIIIFQGSCWCMKKSFYEEIGGLDTDMFGSWGMEAHELSMKAWLIHKGRVVRNTKTWYAHYKKPIQRKSMRDNMIKNMRKVFYMDIFNEWPGQTKTFKWLIDKWPLFPGWDVEWYSAENIKKLEEGMLK